MHQWGFALLPDLKQFRRKVGCGFQSIIISASRYEEEFWVEVNLGVRHEMVEKLAQQFLSLQQTFQPQTNTVIISMGKLLGEPYKRLKVTDEASLVQICQQICTFLEEVGLPQLNRLSDIKQLDFALNFEPQRSARFIYNQQHRCFKGLTVAKLTNNPEFLWLVKTYRGYLCQTGSPEKVMYKYDRLSNYLMHFSVN